MFLFFGMRFALKDYVKKYINISLVTIFFGWVVNSACVIGTVPTPDGKEKQKGTGDDKVNEAPATCDASDYFEGGRCEGDALPVGGVQLLSTASIFYSLQPMILVGSQGSVWPLSMLTILNPTKVGWQTQTRVAVDGSFNVPVNASVGEELWLQLEAVTSEGSIQQLVVLPINNSSFTPATPLLSGGSEWTDDLISTVFTISPPNDQSQVLVSSPLATFATGFVLVVANLNQSVSVEAPVLSDGSTSASLLGVSGDQLLIFIAQPPTSPAGDPSAILLVP